MNKSDQFLLKLQQWRRRYQEKSGFQAWINAQTNWNWSENTTYSRSHHHPQHPLRKLQRPLMSIIAVVSLTTVVGYRFYNQPQLKVGTVSPQTIFAPKDGKFEDSKTTEEKRKELKTAVTPTLKTDLEITAQINIGLVKFLEQIEVARQLAGPFPVVNVNILSLATQRYLRSCQEWEWRTILASLHTEDNTQSIEPSFWSSQQQISPALQQATAELKVYRQQVSELEFENLTTQIGLAREKYEQAWQKITTDGVLELGTDAKLMLLEINQETWEQTKQGTLAVSERILTQGIPQGMTQNNLEATIKIQIGSLIPATTESIIHQLLLDILRPNLVEDREETLRRAEQAALTIQPVIVEIKEGEVIVKEGETITQEAFVLLDAFDLSLRRVNWWGLGMTAIFVGGSIGVFWLVERRFHRYLRCRDHILLCLLSLTSPTLILFNIPYTNLAAVGLLSSSFYGPAIAITQVVLTTGLVGFSQETIAWEYLLAGAAGGLLSAFIAGRLRSREELALLGGSVGLTEGTVNLIATLMVSASAGTVWKIILPEAFLFGFLVLLGWYWRSAFHHTSKGFLTS
jgi:cyclic-di-AMP phosphodiesterase PgpH